MSTLEELIAKHRVEGDDKATATAVLKALGLSKYQIGVLSFILAHYVQTSSTRPRLSRKAAARATCFVPSGKATGPVAHHVVHLNLTPAFLAATFKTARGGQDVTWGGANLNDHRASRKMMIDLRDSAILRIARHAEAERLILATPGAACLNDVAKATGVAA